MKKLFILILAVTFTACNSPADQVGAGFFTGAEGEKYVVGSDDITDVWVNYIKAHNERDMEAIMSMETDKISIAGPDGSTINGKEMHAEALTAWFEAENPMWDIYWALPYEAVGSGSTWIVVGHSMTLTVDGQEVKKNSMIDAEIVDGLVNRFFVYDMMLPPPPPGSPPVE
tara:strand:- start:4325 stop:4837 length:513 start_codon:yes stop_codon:yes gene_type:complete